MHHVVWVWQLTGVSATTGTYLLLLSLKLATRCRVTMVLKGMRGVDLIGHD